MEATQTPTYIQKNKLMVKSIIVGMLILILLIPTVFIQNLVYERENRQKEVAAEVSSKWASSQTLTGPFLTIPYQVPVKDASDKIRYEKKTAYFLPEDLNINGTLLPEIRYRKIYKIVVYRSETAFNGSFVINPEELGIKRENLLLNEAKLCFGLSDFRGIEERINLKWNNSNYIFNAGIPANDVADKGIQTPIGITADDFNKTARFSINLKLKGSEKLYFAPLGSSTAVTLKSSWSNPSFDGNFLPDIRKVDEKGFTANWKILSLNRSYPQSWKEGNYNIKASAFGINLIQSTDSYSKTMRSVKYAILFIALTFMLFFFVEVMQGKIIHPLQYVLIGLALCIFYTLLLSISEYTNFNAAYALSAIATIALITMYAAGVFKQWKVAWVFGSVLSALYGFIFILIQLEDYALLFGSIGLFALLALVMYYSRRIDWFNYAAIKVEPAL